MNAKLMSRLLFGALFLLFLLHNDFWLRYDSSFVLGLPVGLFYHLLYCLAASVLMALVVKFAWPSYLEIADERGSEV